jgi:hypothetical protein
MLNYDNIGSEKNDQLWTFLQRTLLPWSLCWYICSTVFNWRVHKKQCFAIYHNAPFVVAMNFKSWWAVRVRYHLIQNKEKNCILLGASHHQAYCFLIEWSSGGFYWKTLLKVITQMASSRVSNVPSMWVRELTTVGPVWLHFWLSCLFSCSYLASHLL